MRPTGHIFTQGGGSTCGSTLLKDDLDPVVVHASGIVLRDFFHKLLKDEGLYIFSYCLLVYIFK